MHFRRTTVACAIAFSLTVCTSCQVEELDPNGDGVISKSEFLSAAFDVICGDQAGDETPDDETPSDETPADENPDDETPTGETPTGETPLGGLPGEELPASGF